MRILLFARKVNTAFAFGGGIGTTAHTWQEVCSAGSAAPGAAAGVHGEIAMLMFRAFCWGVVGIK